jgi:DNA-binding LytR/AlgR family response regulator
MTARQTDPSPRLFLPPKSYGVALAVLVLLALGLALFLRYRIIQNTPIGLACEAGEESLTCTARLAVILLFVRDAFGWTALGAAMVQLIRPNRVTFAIGLVAGALGLVLYNLRLSALAVALLLLSLARLRSARARAGDARAPADRTARAARSPSAEG